MKPGFVLSISLSVLLTVAAQAQAHPADSARIVEGYGKLPLAFETNQGQSDPQVKFLSRGTGYSLFLTADTAVLSLQPSVPSPLSHRGKTSDSQSALAVLQMKLVNTNPKTQLIGLDELPGRSNYFIGNDPTKWHTNVRQFSKVRYENRLLGTMGINVGEAAATDDGPRRAREKLLFHRDAVPRP